MKWYQTPITTISYLACGKERVMNYVDINMIRYIHRKEWDAKLLEAQISERMKPSIIANYPKIRKEGIAGNSSSDHLVVVKTWMKFKSEIANKLLTNSKSRLGLNQTHLDKLQDFHDRFLRRVFQVAQSGTPKGMLE